MGDLMRFIVNIIQSCDNYPMNKTLKLEKLKKEMVEDKNLPLSANLVFGEGNVDCDVLFIGEAPGALEDELVRPFVGRSGKLLRKSILGLGWREEDVYITNIVKRRPPENRDPTPREIEAYKPYLTRQIEIINPKLIVSLGRFSMNYFLPEAKISQAQGKLFDVGLPSEALAKEGNWRIVPIYHPSAALRGNTMMKAFLESFKKLPAIVKTLRRS